MQHPEYLLLITSLLFLLSIIASKTSGMLGIPALLLFLVLGMLAGSDGIGGIYFDDPHLAQFMGIIALVFILFSGGLDTQWSDIRPIVGLGLILSTVGVLLTALLLGTAAHYLLNFSWLNSFLLGAIVASTDAPSVFSIFRAKRINMPKKLKYLIEFESASNDPMAVFLTIGIIQLITSPSASLYSLFFMFCIQMLLGGIAGLILGYLASFSAQRLNLEFQGLYPVFTIASALFIYSATSLVHGNGFLAVYIAGLVIANRPLPHKLEILQFHDGLTWLMQIAMFLTLGLLVFPSKLIHVAGVDILIAAFLMFIARPVTIFLLTAFSSLQFKEKALLSWVGLRGAVPIILAIFPLVAGIDQAETIFNLVFFIVLSSMLFQGSTISWAAKLLKIK